MTATPPARATLKHCVDPTDLLDGINLPFHLSLPVAEFVEHAFMSSVSPIMKSQEDAFQQQDKSMKMYDVIVSGGGLSGVAAAVAAAREGAQVLLIEKYGFLGGMATAGLVNPFMPYWELSGEGWGRLRDRPSNTGIFATLLNRLDELGGLHQGRTTFNEEILKLVLDRLVRSHGIQVLFHSWVSGVERHDKMIQSIMVTNKSGDCRYRAKYYVDATGDADVSAMAGCEFNIGRDEDHHCQPMTLCFRLAGVDKEKYQPRLAIEKYKEAQQKGLIKNPREDILTFPHMVHDVLHFNSTRIIKKSAVNAMELTEAEMEAREQVFELYRFLKENVPGFENSQILMTAPSIGVRESRRIIGLHTITAEDLLTTVKFPDSIARGTYNVDIHNPSGTGTVFKNIPPKDYYTIPYRALLPKGMDNLIVAGRPISSTHEAHSAYRIMPICTSIGEGAGTAVSIALKNNISLPEVDANLIQNKLDEYGALY